MTNNFDRSLAIHISNSKVSNYGPTDGQPKPTQVECPSGWDISQCRSTKCKDYGSRNSLSRVQETGKRYIKRRKTWIYESGGTNLTVTIREFLHQGWYLGMYAEKQNRTHVLRKSSYVERHEQWVWRRPLPKMKDIKLVSWKRDHRICCCRIWQDELSGLADRSWNADKIKRKEWDQHSLSWTGQAWTYEPWWYESVNGDTTLLIWQGKDGCL